MPAGGGPRWEAWREQLRDRDGAREDEIARMAEHPTEAVNPIALCGEIERQLSFGLVSLITLPWRSRWQGMQMEQATLTAAQDVLRLAADTRRAWLRAVAARQQLASSERMHEAVRICTAASMTPSSWSVRKKLSSGIWIVAVLAMAGARGGEEGMLGGVTCGPA